MHIMFLFLTVIINVNQYSFLLLLGFFCRDHSLKNFTLHDCKRAWSDIPGLLLSVGGILCLHRNPSVKHRASKQHSCCRDSFSQTDPLLHAYMHFTASLHGIMSLQLWLKDDPQETLLTQSIVFEHVRWILWRGKKGKWKVECVSLWHWSVNYVCVRVSVRRFKRFQNRPVRV